MYVCMYVCMYICIQLHQLIVVGQRIFNLHCSMQDLLIVAHSIYFLPFFFLVAGYELSYSMWDLLP